MNDRILNILGVRVSPVNISEVLLSLDVVLKNGIKGYITVTGVHGIIESQFSEYIKGIHNNSYLTVPDGMPLVWLGKFYGFKNMDRCYGPDLMLSVMEVSTKKKYRHFFYGGAPGVAEELKQKMEERFPGVKIVGTYTPPFRPLNGKEESDLIELVSFSNPDIFWVGLSTPKQEIFMYEYLPKLNTKLMIGVGAAFDFHTGRVKQAPLWMQRSGLEWFYRILADPKRLWKRYARNNPLFIYLIALQLLGIRKFK